MDDLKRALKNDTTLVTILIVNNETGIVQKYNEISKIVRNFNDNIVIHYDLVAGFPKILQRFEQIDADLISISGHKLYAPKGIAILYVRSGIKIAPQILGGEQEFGLRAGTENFPGVIFLCKSIKKCIEENEKEQIRLSFLQKYFESRLKSYYGSDILICGENVQRIPNISNICFKDLKSEDIVRELSNYNIFVSSGSACKQDEDQPSHVISAMGIPYNFAKGSVRFSFGRYTTKEEIDYTIDKLREMLKGWKFGT
jgi:cysteine desulfurase